jgi:hypothetical protein
MHQPAHCSAFENKFLRDQIRRHGRRGGRSIGGEFFAVEKQLQSAPEINSGCRTLKPDRVAKAMAPKATTLATV